MALKPRTGDKVHVKGIVLDQSVPTNGDGVRIQFGTNLAIWIHLDDIVHVERAPLKVGDSVRHVLVSNDAPHHTYKIVAIDGEQAWVKAESSGIPIYGCIRLLSELRRADEPRPLKVGDKVRHRPGRRLGEIVRMDKGVCGEACVFVKWDGCSESEPVMLAALERVE